MNKQNIFEFAIEQPQYVVVGVKNHCALCNKNRYNSDFRRGEKVEGSTIKKGITTLNNEIGRTSLYAAANYIVELYDLLNNKYEASPVKVQKLLFIANLTSVYCYGHAFLPEDTKYECNKCGFKIPEVLGEIRNYISGGCLNNQPISSDLSLQERELLYNTLNISLINNTSLSLLIKDLILKTFLNFASFDPVDLGAILNELKTEEFAQEPPFIFEEKKLHSLLRDIDQNSECDNPIILFMVKYRNAIQK